MQVRAEGDRAVCPICGKTLPGRFPNGVKGALLMCRDNRCPGHKIAFQVDIVSRPGAS